MKRLVAYHANCVDGVAAAVAHRMTYERGQKSKNETPNALEKNVYKSINYSDLENDDKFNAIVEDYQDILFLDFCPNENCLRKLLMENRIVTILDHHKTGLEMIQSKFPPFAGTPYLNNLRYIFSADNKLSGATLTWLIGLVGFSVPVKDLSSREIDIHEHKFFTNVKLGFIRSETLEFKDPLYNLIGIRDIWDESNPKLKDKADCLAAYINYFGLLDFEKFYEFVKQEEFVFYGSSIEDRGRMVLEFNNRSVRDALKDSYQYTAKLPSGRELAVAIGTCPSYLGSQFGENWRLQNEGKDTIAIAVFINFKNDTITLGIRSSGVEGLKLAQSFEGGGGHPNACGCRLNNVAVPYEHIGNGVLDGIVWVKHELTERINKLYVDVPMKNWTELR